MDLPSDHCTVSPLDHLINTCCGIGGGDDALRPNMSMGHGLRGNNGVKILGK